MSWIIVDRATGKATEFFDRTHVDALLTTHGVGHKYKAFTTEEYLQRFNKAVREAGGVQPSDEALARAFA